jgi:hypothetical protein
MTVCLPLLVVLPAVAFVQVLIAFAPRFTLLMALMLQPPEMKALALDLVMATRV